MDNTKSNLVLNSRSTLNLTGVKKVKSTESNLVTAILDNGAIMIHGDNLSVQKIDIKEGILELTGNVNSIKYTNQIAKSFSLKNAFK